MFAAGIAAGGWRLREGGRATPDIAGQLASSRVRSTSSQDDEQWLGKPRYRRRGNATDHGSGNERDRVDREGEPERATEASHGRHYADGVVGLQATPTS
jgi:hypothetical protein